MVTILILRRFIFPLRLSLPVVSSINLSRNMIINIIAPYGTKVFNKSVRWATARFNDLKFTTFTARHAVNDVTGVHVNLRRIAKLDLILEIDVVELRSEYVQQRAREQPRWLVVPQF